MNDQDKALNSPDRIQCDQCNSNTSKESCLKRLELLDRVMDANGNIRRSWRDTHEHVPFGIGLCKGCEHEDEIRRIALEQGT